MSNGLNRRELLKGAGIATAGLTGFAAIQLGFGSGCQN